MSVARSLVFLVGASLLGCTSNPPGLGVDAGDTGSDADADTDIDSGQGFDMGCYENQDAE
jgi:hypothetical protein